MSSRRPTTPSVPRKKEKIPATVRNIVWHRYMGESTFGMCTCCQVEQISKANFAAGHVQAERRSGPVTVNNLRPVCTLCNSSMGTMNMRDFMLRYDLGPLPEPVAPAPAGWWARLRAGFVRILGW